jgi:hypothetical protein
MRKHNGMRPQDIVILLKIIALGKKPWQKKDIAQSLYISQSEVSEALNRNHLAGLIDFDQKRVNRQGLVEFLEHGLHYVFPQYPGPMVNGIATAHGHVFMSSFFESDLIYVWPDFSGEFRGLAIEPLYPNQIKAVKEDDELYKLLALVDVIRVGKMRELEVAIAELRKIILNEPQG